MFQRVEKQCPRIPPHLHLLDHGRVNLRLLAWRGLGVQVASEEPRCRLALWSSHGVARREIDIPRCWERLISTYLLTGSDVRLAEHVVTCDVTVVQNTFVPHSSLARALLNLRVRWVGWIRGMKSSTRAYSTRDAAGTRVDCAWELVDHRAVTETGRDTSAQSRVNMAPLLKLLPASLCADGRNSHSIRGRAGKP